jgi:hypothetical protein
MKPQSLLHIQSIMDASKGELPQGKKVHDYVAMLASPDSYFWVHYMVSRAAAGQGAPLHAVGGSGSQHIAAQQHTRTQLLPT